ncbi:unnamed protein product, partial [Mesorhabditis belari]|uniref:Transthyretin-like family protein n=1 Tax=Mesorhabditis belari TaxID=2138241 RepID=A0AAF3F8B0_9BILA
MFTQLAFFALLALPFIAANKQTVGIEGKLTCNGKPYSGAKIKLYDHDTLTMDDKLGETQTDNTGYFKLVGTGSEVSRLNVKFNVYHRCGKTLPVCYYKYSWAVPQSYVSSGTYPQKMFNAQTIELSLLEKHRDCLN